MVKDYMCIDSQQLIKFHLLCYYRLMMILLPPVPAPKIKGIDPELLKVQQHVI